MIPRSQENRLSLIEYEYNKIDEVTVMRNINLLPFSYSLMIDLK